MTRTHSSRETMGSMAATLKMPYTLTPGRSTGIFLAALAQQQILGSRCTACSTVRVPAQDVCPDCGGESPEIVRVPETGVLEAWTQTDQGVIALVRLDGTDISLLHRLVSADGTEMGGRVSAVWNDERTGAITDISVFAVEPNAAVGVVSDIDLATIEPIELMNYTMQLDYQHAYGHYYGTLFDGVKNDRRIRGVRCPSCRSVLVPPRPYCDACFVPTADWMDVPDTGVVQACSVVHIEFMGQRVPPPYVYAEIMLDGTATRLIHTVGGLSAESAREGGVRPGSRVQAVWSDRTTGSLSDIEYFRVLGEGE